MKMYESLFQQESDAIFLGFDNSDRFIYFFYIRLYHNNDSHLNNEKIKIN